MQPTLTPPPTPLVQVLPGIHRWSVWNEPRKLWFNGHLLRVGEELIAIDPVELSEEVAAQLSELGAPTLCILTNRDHERAAAEVRARFGCPVRVPRRDAAAMTLPVSESDLYDPGELFAGELLAVAVESAKTPGETALSWPSRRALILGDAAVGRPAGGLSMLPAERFADLAAARAAVAQLAALGADLVLVGDGEDVLTGGAAALAALGDGPARAPFSSGAPGC